MKKVRININHEKFTEQEIEQSMNFGKIISSVTPPPKPFFKTPRFYAGIFTAAIIITVVVLKFTKNNSSRFIDPPLKGVNITYSEFKVNNNSDTVFDYTTGSVIYVPKNAFLDKEGNPVHKKAILKYREMHTPADFFLSGIPMNYDSAGITYPFESAGMLDIKAVDEDGNLLFANPKAPITIGMASPQKDNKYNIYYLDTNARKWKFIGKDTSKKKSDSTGDSKFLKDTCNKMNSEESVNAELQKTPVVPRKADSKKYHFKISFNKKDFPEMAVYENVLFEVDTRDENFKPVFASTTWENVELKNGSAENEYLATFSKGAETHTFIVHPVFETGDYKAALKVYTKKYNDYQNAYKVKMENEKKEKEKKKKEQETLNENRTTELKNVQTQLIVWQQRMDAKMKTEDIFFRTLQVNNFGVWNCDYPASLPQGIKLNANFTDENGNKLILDKVYLVEKGRNAVFTYTNVGFINFQFNPNAENMIWAVTNDNKIAVYSPENFAAISKNDKSFTFKLNTTDKTFTDYNEVKTFLNI